MLNIAVANYPLTVLHFSAVLCAIFRLIFVNELMEGRVNAYMRSGDNTLTLVQVCVHDSGSY